MTVINLTSHEITLEGIPAIPPSGIVARVCETRDVLPYCASANGLMWSGGGPGYGEMADDDGIGVPPIIGVPVVRKNWGEVEGLPPQKRDTYYIVSALVANACTDRTDLLCPETKRLEDGQIICTALVTRHITFGTMPGDGFRDRHDDAKKMVLSDYDRGRLDGLVSAVRHVTDGIQSVTKCTFSEAAASAYPLLRRVYEERDAITAALSKVDEGE